MSTYAFQQDVEQYIEGWVTDDPFALDRMIRRCEHDVDRILVRTRFALPPTQIFGVPGAAGGSYILSWVDYNGVTNTATVQWNATADQIQADIVAWPAVGAGNVTVMGTGPFTVVWDPSWARSNYVGRIAPAIDFQVLLFSIDATATTPPGSKPVIVQERGRKISPLTDGLDETQVLALANATCAQVEYRNAMGENFFNRPQYDSVRGPDFTTTGRLPMIAPKVKRELSESGLVRASGRATASRLRKGVGIGWANY